MNSIIQGYVTKFGDNIDTDQIYPGRYLELTDPREIGHHAMEGADPNFVSKIKAPGIILAGENFGCGSSREHAVITLLHAGIKCVVASSFGRIFFRNAINLGLPAIVCANIHKEIEENQSVEINLKEGVLRITGTDRKFDTQKMPTYVRNIIDSGGLISSIREKIRNDEVGTTSDKVYNNNL
jgi:3-isopropylmalate/(R)-2-methylmalate dehydratase small subunit